MVENLELKNSILSNYIISVPKESYLQVMLILVTIAEIIIFVVAAQLIKLRLKKNIFVF